MQRPSCFLPLPICLFGCAGSWLLVGLFPSCGHRAALCFSEWASLWWSVGPSLQELWLPGSRAQAPELMHRKWTHFQWVFPYFSTFASLCPSSLQGWCFKKLMHNEWAFSCPEACGIFWRRDWTCISWIDRRILYRTGHGSPPPPISCLSDEAQGSVLILGN